MRNRYYITLCFVLWRSWWENVWGFQIGIEIGVEIVNYNYYFNITMINKSRRKWVEENVSKKNVSSKMCLRKMSLRRKCVEEEGEGEVTTLRERENKNNTIDCVWECLW
jgi:hypothetical protein